MQPAGATRYLAEWSTTTSWGGLVESDRSSVINSVVDTVGVGLVGSVEPVARIAREYVTESAAPGPAELWATQRGVTSAAAALANGAAAHALDFDDMHYRIRGHPSCSLVPALFAVAQEEGLTGIEVLDGYVAGIGFMGALSALYGAGHYQRGWHATSSIGTVGAAVAVSRMLSLPSSQVAEVIGLATSFASGSRANFGTMAKPIHAGWAARSAVDAVHLVARGVTSNPAVIEASHGGMAIFGDGSVDPSPSSGADRDWLLGHAEAAIREKGIKKYPCCGGTHFGVDAALEARRQLPSNHAISRVTVRVPYGGLLALDYDDPATGLEGKFSLPYAVASTLAHGEPTITTFTDDAVSEPESRRIMEVLEVREGEAPEDLGPTGGYAEVLVELGDGSTVRSRAQDHRGTPSQPLTRAEVDRKFLMCAAEVVDADAARSLLAKLHELPDGRPMSGIFAARV